VKQKEETEAHLYSWI